MSKRRCCSWIRSHQSKVWNLMLQPVVQQKVLRLDFFSEAWNQILLLSYQILGFPRTRMSRRLSWQDVKLLTKSSHAALTVGWKTISTHVGRMRTGLPYAVRVWPQEFHWNSRIWCSIQYVALISHKHQVIVALKLCTNATRSLWKKGWMSGVHPYPIVFHEACVGLAKPILIPCSSLCSSLKYKKLG